MTGKLMYLTRSFATDDSGATAIEYGLIAAGLSIVVALAVGLAGTALRDVLFGPIAAAIGGA
ncbi:MAG: Flp family type IVb pilin [Parvibaculum sp.]|jgi:pilus assembly protein Flp/PilA|uniref:Flp family type IVb pilin n=1 Tax=Parvibaculum sp. TaxID=2024848 RepID=UPI0034A02FDC